MALWPCAGFAAAPAESGGSVRDAASGRGSSVCARSLSVRVYIQAHWQPGCRTHRHARASGDRHPRQRPAARCSPSCMMRCGSRIGGSDQCWTVFWVVSTPSCRSCGPGMSIRYRARPVGVRTATGRTSLHIRICGRNPVSVWIPLTEATTLNGCMYVMPKHRDPHYGFAAVARSRRHAGRHSCVTRQPGGHADLDAACCYTGARGRAPYWPRSPD